MGLVFTSEKKKIKFTIFGLDRVGKKKILLRYKHNQDMTTYPAKGLFFEEFDTTFNEETISIEMMVVCGQNMYRPLWPNNYSKDSKGVIFVIDSTDYKRMHEIKFEIQKSNDLIQVYKNDPFLIFANKQDLPDALPITTIIDLLDLHKLSSNRKWHIQESIATTGFGLDKGLIWLLYHT